jgi:hypothetical protein
MAALLPAASIEDRLPRERVQMLALNPGDTLSPCQTFFWRDAPRTTRYWIRIGSCRFCADLAFRDVTGSLSARVSLPSDGRPIYVALYSFVAGVWQAENNVYRSPSTGVADTCDAAPETFVGVYHWSGSVTRSMSQGVEAVAELGGRAVRVTLSARYRLDYNIGGDCYEDFTLPKAAQEADIRSAFSHPDIETYMITVKDGTSFGDCWHKRFLSPSFYTAENRAALVEEYADFVYGLYRTYAGSKKRFILSNWEGDNNVYCGAAHRYIHDEDFRANCNESYPLRYGGNIGPSDSIQGLRQWFSARWEGIQEGRRRGVAEGYEGVAVHSAPELNIVRGLAEAGLPSLLYDVIPFVRFDFVSYSSWESINREDLVQELTTDLNTIREIAGAQTVILGEFGFAQSVWGENAIARTEAVLAAAIEWGAPYMFQWALYDDGGESNTGFGLFDENGNLSSVGRYYQLRFSGHKTP